MSLRISESEQSYLVTLTSHIHNLCGEGPHEISGVLPLVPSTPFDNANVTFSSLSLNSYLA